ncbi:MAG: hypothetical protein KJZ83_16810, partial [Burkholderiaceae bacterium]|nr:hypothetical protein [Burkholderiaceae bacterium]
AAGPLDAAAREDFGRRAFSALAAGNVAAYKMMLCRATLLNYQRPGLERVLDDFSHRIRVDQVELTDVAGRKSQRVYFNATEVADRRSGKREAYSGVYAIEVEQEADGRTCTNGLSVTNRRSAW